VRLQCSRLQIIVSDASARQATRNSAAERQNLCIIVMLHKPGECLIFRQNDGPYKVEPGRGRVIAWNPSLNMATRLYESMKMTASLASFLVDI
jgi:hypothetical protein